MKLSDLSIDELRRALAATERVAGAESTSATIIRRALDSKLNPQESRGAKPRKVKR